LAISAINNEGMPSEKIKQSEGIFGILAQPKRGVLSEASQSLECFAGLNKIQCQEKNISNGFSRYWFLHFRK